MGYQALELHRASATHLFYLVCLAHAELFQVLTNLWSFNPQLEIARLQAAARSFPSHAGLQPTHYRLMWNQQTIMVLRLSVTASTVSRVFIRIHVRELVASLLFGGEQYRTCRRIP